MHSVDEVEEWRRLKELYARMNEGELEVLANEVCDLTEIARPILKDEISRRGLGVQLRAERSVRPLVVENASDGFSSSDLELVTVNTSYSLDAANKVKAFLTASGVPSYWGPDNVENPNEVHLSFEEGVEIRVRKDDAPRVRAGIALICEPNNQQPIDCNFVCPECHSPEIVFHDLDATAKFSWSCDACGHEWEDDGIEQEA